MARFLHFSMALYKYKVDTISYKSYTLKKGTNCWKMLDIPKRLKGYENLTKLVFYFIYSRYENLTKPHFYFYKKGEQYE